MDANQPSWTALPPRRRNKRKAETEPGETPQPNAFAERAASNAAAVAANVAARAEAHARGRPEVQSAPEKKRGAAREPRRASRNGGSRLVELRANTR